MAQATNNLMYPLIDNGGYTSNNDASGDSLANMATETEVVTVQPTSNVFFWLFLLVVIAWFIWGKK